MARGCCERSLGRRPGEDAEGGGWGPRGALYARGPRPGGLLARVPLVGVPVPPQLVPLGGIHGRNELERIEWLAAGIDLRLSAVSGCPVVTFMIGTTKVTTSVATTFEDVTCATLANGALVEVEGSKQPDGSILATKVEAEAGPDELTGTVFEFSGAASCPAATFKVGPVLSLATKVTLTASTTFTGVTPADRQRREGRPSRPTARSPRPTSSSSSGCEREPR